MPFVTDPKGGATKNRAEKARQRRAKRSQDRVSTANNRAVNPVRTQPVTVRGGLTGKPILNQAGTRRARRQYYVTMDQHGSELRLPAIPAFHPGWRILSALVAILALAGIVTLWSSPFFQIEAVEVNGLQRIQPSEVTDLLRLENLSIVEVDPTAEREAIAKAFPELTGIQVSVDMPNFVSVSATERQPVLAWQKGDKVEWVDTQGIIIPARGEPAGPLVVINSEDDIPLAPLPISDLSAQIVDPEAQSAPVDYAKPGILAQLLQPAATQPAEKPKGLEKADPVLLAAAQELNQKLPEGTRLIFQKEHGLGWEDPMGWQVYIGRDLNQFAAKYNLYQKVASYLAEQGLQPYLVSVEHLNAPFYRLEQ